MGSATPVAGSTVAAALIFNGVGLRYPVATMTTTSHGAGKEDVGTPVPPAYGT